MKIVRLSAYTVEHGSSGVLLDFEKYSKFKYGFKPTTIIFAKKLLSLFLKKYGIEYFSTKPGNVIITTSPYRNAFRQISTELKRREYQTSDKPAYSTKK